MKTNSIITGYAIIITLIIIVVIAWRAGYHTGQEDTLQRVEGVLNNEIGKPHLGGTFDAICEEFATEWE